MVVGAQMKPEQLQAAYYQQTASRYDEVHAADPRDAHYTALQIVDAMSNLFGLKNFLDVGAGTGRAALFLRDRGKQVRGIEPVKALIEQANQKGLPPDAILCGDGRSLPFRDHSFDAVVEFGMLHHVAEPSRVVEEMMRVARKAVFLSDSNRFGQGGAAARAIKLMLYKTGLWKPARYLQTRGKYYTIADGDGLTYSYSIYDSYDQLAVWADVIWCLPTGTSQSSQSWLSPLLSSSHGLLCALRTGCGGMLASPLAGPNRETNTPSVTR